MQDRAGTTTLVKLDAPAVELCFMQPVGTTGRGRARHGSRRFDKFEHEQRLPSPVNFTIGIIPVHEEYYRRPSFIRARMIISPARGMTSASTRLAANGIACSRALMSFERKDLCRLSSTTSALRRAASRARTVRRSCTVSVVAKASTTRPSSCAASRISVPDAQVKEGRATVGWPRRQAPG